MNIDGVKYQKSNNCSFFIIEHLSGEFKNIIKTQLSGIFNGLAHATELPNILTLNSTLKSFVQRYQSKDANTKKGMIGELLAHLLINNFHEELNSVSILKNKEDKSIKKGFDIIYFNPSTNKLWFSEVKSGESDSDENNASESNKILLNRSKVSIQTLFSDDRDVLWESALIDVQLTISSNARRINISELLSSEINVINRDSQKHVILVSTLYHDIADEVEFQSLLDYYNNLVAENIFLDIIIMSIQKRTYDAVANFIINESLIHE